MWGRVDVPELLPTVLAQACVEVLPVAGAGLSVTRALGSPGLRVPLGASDEAAARVERLQTSLGEGPCLAAADRKEPLMVHSSGMASRWPVFHAELIGQTPFRSVASLPVLWGDPADAVAALDLYLVVPMPGAGSRVDGERHRRDHRRDAVRLLTHHPVARGTAPGVDDRSIATQRMNVWVAVGILIGHAGLSSADALAVLRAYAFGHGVTLDDLAEDMTTQRLDPETVLGTN